MLEDHQPSGQKKGYTLTLSLDGQSLLLQSMRFGVLVGSVFTHVHILLQPTKTCEQMIPRCL